MAKDYKINYVSWIEESISLWRSIAGGSMEIRGSVLSEVKDLYDAAKDEGDFTGHFLYDLLQVPGRPAGTFKLRNRNRELNQMDLNFFAKKTPIDADLEDTAEYRLEALEISLKTVIERFDSTWY